MSETLKNAARDHDDAQQPPGNGVVADEQPGAKALALDWDGLERALVHPSPGAETYLDAHTGEVIDVIDGWSDDHGFAEQDLADGLVSGRLVAIEPLPLETVQGWMSAFASQLDDGWARDALRETLAGEASIRTFEETLGRFPRERLAWLGRWEECVAAVLRTWLEAKDIAPTTERWKRGLLR